MPEPQVRGAQDIGMKPQQSAIARAARFGYRVPVIRVRPNGPSAAVGNVADLPPTLWSVVARAGDREREAWTAALDHVVAAYRPMLVRHLVDNRLRLADRAKGRFRSFLLKVFSNFVADELRRQGARKRRATGSAAVALDDLPELPSAEASLADALDAVWARQVLARTVERVRDECLSTKRPALWEVFEARVLGPLLDQSAPMPYEQVVARFGLRSPSEASNLLVAAKRAFVRALHDVVRETVAGDRDVEPEIRELKRILSK